MNADTRPAALLTAAAIRSVGTAFHADRHDQCHFDILAATILGLHDQGVIDFEGFWPVYPDTRGMSEAARAEAIIENAFQWVSHWVYPNASDDHEAHIASRQIAERLTWHTDNARRHYYLAD